MGKCLCFFDPSTYPASEHVSRFSIAVNDRHSLCEPYFDLFEEENVWVVAVARTDESVPSVRLIFALYDNETWVR